MVHSADCSLGPMRERVDLKSPVREYRPPGSVRGAPGNRCPYLDNLGFLKEQSGRYQVAYASVHLAALRYLLLFEAMLRQGRLSYGEIRDQQSGRLQTLSYAALLWQLFRSLIEGALDGLVRELGQKLLKKILAAIDQTVESFLNDALQISPHAVAVQLRAEELGYL
jgi:hypothetical protein